MAELKPCPFCGGEARVSDCGWGHCYVRCTNTSGMKCPVRPITKYFDRANKAIEAWNRRAGDGNGTD
jgi:hypothetical protein